MTGLRERPGFLLIFRQFLIANVGRQAQKPFRPFPGAPGLHTLTSTFPLDSSSLCWPSDCPSGDELADTVASLPSAPDPPPPESARSFRSALIACPADEKSFSSSAARTYCKPVITWPEAPFPVLSLIGPDPPTAFSSFARACSAAVLFSEATAC